MDLQLADGLDPAALAGLFAPAGRLQIAGFLSGAGGEALLRGLAASREWVLTFNQGERIIDYDAAALAVLTPADRAAMSRTVAEGARQGFQFCYETIRLPKRGAERPATPLAAVEAFLNWAPVLDFLRTVTGAADIAFADAHASRYRPSHFLTAHDDEVEGQGRRAAYVLNLTPEWRSEWGGMLLFHDRQGNVTRGFRPSFNTLNLFTVPQAHSVSYVTPLAPHPRYAVTGWLRAA